MIPHDYTFSLEQLQEEYGSTEEDYVSLQLLSSGTVADLFLAYKKNKDKDETVILKKYHLEIETNSPHTTSQARKKALAQEITALMEYDTPHIPQFKSIFPSFPREGVASPTVVLACATGTTLEQKIKEGKPYSQLNVKEGLISLLLTLNVIHNTGTALRCHRDLKPGIVIQSATGALSLLDFGVLTPELESVLRETRQVGTSGYTAPEQWEGKATPVSDVYSLGRIFLQLIQSRMGMEEPDFKELKRTVDPTLCTILQRMTEKDPYKRYQSVTEVLQSLGAKVESLSSKGESPYHYSVNNYVGSLPWREDRKNRKILRENIAAALPQCREIFWDDEKNLFRQEGGKIIEVIPRGQPLVFNNYHGHGVYVVEEDAQRMERQAAGVKADSYIVSPMRYSHGDRIVALYFFKLAENKNPHSPNG